MKKSCVLGIGLAVMGIALSGCEWTSGGGASGWSDRYNWVNFSGVYRGTTGGILISDYTSGVPGGGASSFVVTGERIGTGTAGVTDYNGDLSKQPITAGSVTISVGAVTLVDDGAGALGGAGGDGTITYATGAWSISLAAAPAAGTPIVASYTYTTTGTIGTGSGAVSSGVEGDPIYAFTIVQTGERIDITDNTGATYSGKISSIRSTGGISRNTASDDTTVLPQNGDTVIASFEASGTSSARKSVKIVGTLQGTVVAEVVAPVAGVTEAENSYHLTGRVLNGTWIEKIGKTGNISGAAD